MGYYIILDVTDKNIDIVTVEERTSDIPNIKKLLRIFKLGLDSTINNGSFDLKSKWINVLQPYFKHQINPKEFDYTISFEYSVVPNKHTIDETELTNEDYNYWKKVKKGGVKRKFINADKFRRKFKNSELVVVIERENANNRMVSREWETIDFGNDLKVLEELKVKLSRFAFYPHLELNRNSKKIISKYLTKKLVGKRNYIYTAYFYFSRKTKYKFI